MTSCYGIVLPVLVQQDSTFLDALRFAKTSPSSAYAETTAGQEIAVDAVPGYVQEQGDLFPSAEQHQEDESQCAVPFISQEVRRSTPDAEVAGNRYGKGVKHFGQIW